MWIGFGSGFDWLWVWLGVGERDVERKNEGREGGGGIKYLVSVDVRPKLDHRVKGLVSKALCQRHW